MDIDVIIADLFNELSFEYFISSQDYIFLIYPLPVRKFYIFLKNISNLLEKFSDDTDINYFFYKNNKKILEILKNSLNIDKLELNEDETVELFFKIININLPKFTNIEKAKDETIPTIKKLKDNIKNLINNIESLLENYIKLNNKQIEQNFGNISDGPFLLCLITNNFCNPSCKYFDIEDVCKKSYYSFKYISFKGLITLVNLLSYHSLEEKNFYYKLLTGDDLLSKTSTLTIKKELNRSKEYSINKEEIISNLSKKIKEIYKNINLKLLTDIYKDLDSYIKRIKEIANPDDITIDEIINIILYNEDVFCDGIKYLLFIRNNIIKNEFPYNSDYSLKKAKEEYETYIEIKKNNKLKENKVYWNEERYNSFIKAFNNNNIILMKIFYDDYYYAWYKYHYKKKEISFENLILKYIIDKFISHYSYTFSHGIYIFENEKSIENLKINLKKMKECIGNKFNLGDYIVPGKIYILNKEKLENYKKTIKNKLEEKKEINISFKYILNNIKKFKELGILEEKGIKLDEIGHNKN